MTIWWLIRLRLAMWALKAAWRVTKWLVTAAVLVAATPVTIVAATGFAGAWLRGWPPARLFRAALWSLPAAAVYRRRASRPVPGGRRPLARPGLGGRVA